MSEGYDRKKKKNGGDLDLFALFSDIQYSRAGTKSQIRGEVIGGQLVILSIPHSRPILWSTQYKGQWKLCIISQKMIVPLNANVTTQFSLKKTQSVRVRLLVLQRDCF